MTNLEKAIALEKVDKLLDSSFYGIDKKANLRVRIKSFEGYYLELEILVQEGYSVNKKMLIEDFEKGYKENKIYVVNPSFCNKYFKQKWYRKVRNLD